MKFIQQHAQLFQPLVMSSPSLEDHIQRMCCLKQWGTQVEMQAAASLFQRELYVFTQLPSSTQYNWIRYEPHSPVLLELPDIEFSKVLGKLTHLELCHKDRCHFECIVDEENHIPIMCPHLPGSVSHVDSVL